MQPIADVASLNVLPVSPPDLAGVLAMIGGPRVTAGGISLAELKSGEIMLWVVIEGQTPPALRAVFATAITEHDGRPFVDVAGLAGVRRGQAPRLVHAIDAQMQEHARRMGCAGVRFVGREAYRRLLPQYQVRGQLGEMPIFERVL